MSVGKSEVPYNPRLRWAVDIHWQPANFEPSANATHLENTEERHFHDVLLALSMPRFAFFGSARHKFMTQCDRRLLALFL